MKHYLSQKSKLIYIQILLGMGIMTTSYAQQTEKWVAPPTADRLTNTVKGNLDATKTGKKIYQQNCAICHGSKGKGDGVAGMSLKPRPTNFTASEVQAQSDGALFWKISKGRSPMASYQATFNETERWSLVNYLRTLK